MKQLFLFFTMLLALGSKGQTAADIKSRQVKLPNGWSLSPVGKSLPLGDLPLNIAVSASKRLMAVTNNGQSTQSIQLIDVQKEKICDSITIPNSWYGLQFSADEKYLYASGGNDNWILKYKIVHNKLITNDTIKLGNRWPEKISPSGIAIDDAAHALYVVTKENNSLYVVNLLSKKIINKIGLDGEAYACLLSPEKKSYIFPAGAAIK